MTQVRAARFADLDAPTLYALLRLRVDVFVVEQACPYPELDGRDTEPDTWHHWVERDGRVIGCLRLLAEPAEPAQSAHAPAQWRIGRVCVDVTARGKGLAEALVRAALARCDGPVALDAQSHLAGWYERLGFTASGPQFLEDGIAHVPMRRDPGPPVERAEHQWE